MGGQFGAGNSHYGFREKVGLLQAQEGINRSSGGSGGGELNAEKKG